MTVLDHPTGPDPAVHDLVIIGSGPAGYTAAIYAARANLDPIVLEGDLWGGLLQETTAVENFPGFAAGVQGPELMSTMREQAVHFGARLVTTQAIDLAVDPAGAGHRVTQQDGTVLTARTVVLATGATHRKLGVPGEDSLSGHGVSYCATCDAAFFRGQHTVVVGGGDSAMEEALFLARFAATVTIVHRRTDFRASPIMVERARATENISWATPHHVDAFTDDGTGSLTGVRLRHAETGATRTVPATGVFVAVGHQPRSELAAGQLELDPAGYIRTVGRSTRTSAVGVFAAGDVVDHTYRQAITAAGMGCQAALEAGWHLRDHPERPGEPAAAGATATTTEAHP